MNEEDAPQQVVVLLDTRHAQSNCPTPLPSVEGVPVDLLDSGVVITPPEVAGTKHSFMQVIVTIDPKMTVPKALVNSVTRTLCFLIMYELQRAVRVTRTPVHLERTTDPHNAFYNFIRKRMAESLPAQLELAPSLREKRPSELQKTEESNDDGFFT